MRMKNSLLILCFLLTIFCSGCIYKEIEDYAIAAGIGVDYENNKYQITLEILMEESGKTTDQKSSIITVEDENLSVAMNDLKYYYPLEVFLNHCVMIIFGEKLAQEKLKETISYFVSNPHIRSSVYTMVAKEKTAKEIFELKNKDAYPIISLSLLESINKVPTIAGVWAIDRFHHSVNMLLMDKISLVMPIVTLEEDKLYIDGGAIFDGYKLAAYADALDIIVLQLIWGFDIKGTAHLSDELTFEIERISSDLKYENINKLNVDIGIDVNFMDNTNIDLESAEAIRKLQLKIKTEIEKVVIDTIKKYQSDGLDVIGCEFLMYRKNGSFYRKVEDNFLEHFKNIEIVCNTNVNIRTSGVTGRGM